MKCTNYLYFEILDDRPADLPSKIPKLDSPSQLHIIHTGYYCRQNLRVLAAHARRLERRHHFPFPPIQTHSKSRASNSHPKATSPGRDSQKFTTAQFTSRARTACLHYPRRSPPLARRCRPKILEHPQLLQLCDGATLSATIHAVATLPSALIKSPLRPRQEG